MPVGLLDLFDIIRASSKVWIPAAIAKLANVCRIAYGVRWMSPAALTDCGGTGPGAKMPQLEMERF